MPKRFFGIRQLIDDKRYCVLQAPRHEVKDWQGVGRKERFEVDGKDIEVINL